MARRRRTTEEVTVNLTPMIDVVFLLVIFFMVGANFGQGEQRIQGNVPGVGELRSMTRQPDERLVEVSGDGRVMLDSQPISLDQLAMQIRYAYHQYPQIRVAVRGDGDASFQQVAEVLQVIRSTGVQQMGIAAKSVRR
jgi:biopolymer transport protein ExbD